MRKSWKNNRVFREANRSPKDCFTLLLKDAGYLDSSDADAEVTDYGFQLDIFGRGAGNVHYKVIYSPSNENWVISCLADDYDDEYFIDVDSMNLNEDPGDDINDYKVSVPLQEVGVEFNDLIDCLCSGEWTAFDSINHDDIKKYYL